MALFLAELFSTVAFVWNLPILEGLSVSQMFSGFVVISLFVWIAGLSVKDDAVSAVRAAHEARDLKKKESEEKKEDSE